MLVLVMAELSAIMGATRMILVLVKPPNASEGERIPNAASSAQQVIVVTPMGNFCHTNITIMKARIANVIINWDVISELPPFVFYDQGLECKHSCRTGRHRPATRTELDLTLTAAFLLILAKSFAYSNSLFDRF